MRVAVSAWEGRISPVFDTARRLRYFDVEGGAGRAVGDAELSPERPQATLATLRRLGVDVLLCGAISRPLAALLLGAGIQLIPFVAGEVEETVAAFAGGRLDGTRFHMPGCCGMARRHRGGRRAGKWEIAL